MKHKPKTITTNKTTLMDFKFNLDEINVIMASLGKMPYESVFQLVNKIREQAEPQLKESEQITETAEVENAEV